MKTFSKKVSKFDLFYTSVLIGLWYYNAALITLLEDMPTLTHTFTYTHHTQNMADLLIRTYF